MKYLNFLVSLTFENSALKGIFKQLWQSIFKFTLSNRCRFESHFYYFYFFVICELKKREYHDKRMQDIWSTSNRYSDYFGSFVAGNYSFNLMVEELFNRQIIQSEFSPTWSCVSLTRSTTSSEWKLFRFDKMEVNCFQILPIDVTFYL